MPPPSATGTETASSSSAAVQVNAQVMPPFPRPPVFKDKYKERQYLKGRLAAAFRIFGKYGFDEGVAGHITLRDPVDPTTFWVNPFGVAFSLINASDLIQVGHDGRVIDGGKCITRGQMWFALHTAIVSMDAHFVLLESRWI
ncbi:class II aldolase/adducin domain-containing protein [Histoplasma capsulatum]|uniref:Class II aldolase/adducin domain-containing protein n=1 Tax=Ajellomyces capsulatus TaxID=5037 RepID=A0A8A1M5Y7_AJECA|nr:class II aldolase/adducin domain-containing protein [Histoplasma capsulatum]